MSFSLIFNVGKYGGFYVFNGTAMKRVVLGWIAFTVVVPEFDEIFNEVIEKKEKESSQGNTT
jgi:hypothetical protein